MIASELVSNAVQASAPVQAAGAPLLIRVCLTASRNVLMIEVWDQAPGIPVRRDADTDEESGRGLAIVDALTGGWWGCHPATARRGKCVWASIPLNGTAGPRLTA